MKMARFASCAVIAAMLAGVMTGCAGGSEAASTKTVSTDGSTSMEAVIGYLSEAYMEKNSDVKVTYNPTGSGSGIQAVQEGRCDIGLSSRNLKDEEKADLIETVIAYDGIAVIINPDNPITDLTVEQIAQVYTGEITNWNEIGGNDTPIVCIGREAASGTRDGFEAITGTEDKCKYTQELTSTGDVVQTVSSNPNAIGYASLPSVKDSVKAISVEGIVPSSETILSGDYKIQRDFILVTRKDKELTDSSKDFFDFCMSTDADEYIIKAGAVPVEK